MQEQVQFSVFLINKPGVLASVTGALAKARVNIMALTLMDSTEHGVLRIVCENADLAREVLSKAHDRWTETEVLAIELSNEPGAFAHVARELSEAHINISYAYVTGGAGDGRTNAVFKVADMKKAAKVLAESHKKSTGKDKKAARTVKRPGGRRG